MKLSLRGEYALRALVVLGQAPPTAVVPIQRIASAQNIPKRFLEQILNDLKAAGLVESRRGVAGGYRLHLPATQIPLSTVIRSIEGPLAPVSCVSERYYAPCTCPDEAKCAIRTVMREVREAIVGVLDGVTVAQLCDRARRLQAGAENLTDYVI